MSSPEEFFYNVQRAPNVDVTITPTAKALELLRNESRGAPNWRYRNVSSAPVTVAFGTSRFSPERQSLVHGPVVRIQWAPGEEVEIPANFAAVIHDVRIPVGATEPICMGGTAPCQLVRTHPKQDYQLHPSLLPNPAAEAAAVRRPKTWIDPKVVNNNE